MIILVVVLLFWWYIYIAMFDIQSPKHNIEDLIEDVYKHVFAG